MRMLLLLVPVLFLSAAPLAGDAEDAEKRAVDAIENLGARVHRDDSLRGKPVVRIFWDSPLPVDRDLALLKAFPRLDDLVIDCRKATDAGLAHLNGLKELRELRVYGTQFTDKGLGHLKGMKQLRSLYYITDELTDAGLPHLKGMSELRKLVLSSPVVSDAGLEHLKSLKNLRTLDLGSRSKVTGKGADALNKVLPALAIFR